jgi:hypothetical protein
MLFKNRDQMQKNTKKRTQDKKKKRKKCIHAKCLTMAKENKFLINQSVGEDNKPVFTKKKRVF